MGAAVIDTEVFAELPARLRKSGTPPERLAAGKSSTPMGSFLEGPSFDRHGNLYVVDLAWGRIFRVDERGEFHVEIEYDGEPNGLAIHKDGRIFIADHKHGILRLENGKVVSVVSRYHQQTFKGVNDLTFDPQGNLYFTDQGVTDMADATGAVYCYTAAGKLVRLAACLPSPNGLVVDTNVVYVAVTRANAVWRLPLAPDGTVCGSECSCTCQEAAGPTAWRWTSRAGSRSHTSISARCGSSATAAKRSTACRAAEPTWSRTSRTRATSSTSPTPAAAVSCAPRCRLPGARFTRTFERCRARALRGVGS